MRLLASLIILSITAISNQVYAQANSSSSGSMSMINFSNPATTTSTNRLVTTPTVAAPGLAAAGVETCLGSAVGGLSLMGGGFTIGSTKVDEGCTIRLLARQLFSFGFQKAALALMCQDSHVAVAMAATGTPCPPPSAPAPALADNRPQAPVSNHAQSNDEELTTGSIPNTSSVPTAGSIPTVGFIPPNNSGQSDEAAQTSAPIAASEPLPISTHLHLSFLPVARTAEEEEAWFDRASHMN